MEFVEGETAEASVKRQGPLPTALAIHVAEQVAGALEAAHKAGLIHRDIKPSNVMLVPQPAGLPQVKLIDFGLAKFTETEMDLTQTHGMVGTLYFASPEQLENKVVDARSDIYLLGATLWHLLTGAPPFTGTLGEVWDAHLHARRPIERLAGHGAAFVSLLERMLAREPDARPKSAGELLVQLQETSREMMATASAPPRELVSLVSVDSVAPGMLIARRYRLGPPIRRDVAGAHFQAEDLEQHQSVEVTALEPRLFASGADWAGFARYAQDAARASHAGLRAIFGLHIEQGLHFLIREALADFSLVELLRVRRALPLAEAVPILAQIAEAVDFACARGLARLRLDPAIVMIQWPAVSDAPARERGLRESVLSWPNLRVKVEPCALPGALGAGATWSGEATQVARTAPADRGEDLQARGVREFAQLTAALLGAHLRAPFDPAVGPPPPLPALSEDGNATLRRAIIEAGSFSSAREFVESLKRDANERRPSAPIPVQHASPGAVLSAPSRPSRLSPLIGAAAVVVALTAVAGFFLVKNPSGPATPAPRPATPLPARPAPATPATPLPATPPPTTRRPRPVPPSPLLRDGITLLDAGKIAEAHQRFDSALAAGEEAARVGLAMIYMRSPASEESVQIAGALLREGARRGDLDCMFNYGLWLEKSTDLNERREAGTWFEKAAQAGSEEAKLKLETPPR